MSNVNVAIRCMLSLLGVLPRDVEDVLARPPTMRPTHAQARYFTGSKDVLQWIYQSLTMGGHPAGPLFTRVNKIGKPLNLDNDLNQVIDVHDFMIFTYVYVYEILYAFLSMT